ncbi:NADH-ubiquinone oxidoreductase 29.9 kDa subunit [Penicillium argentinense]|uniref:NADH-ubiquinone oxidoreductase 29.9 kDa subunit n=1 Tax=Penicillium argentinense TaxID=1131581 RepID=A0A9W9G5M7_9EURO|nr:NADH-ubiquinone oxidoreductase 29.9 kDa subunit [Penicillium argentinense]KAJ5112467.1 NADH-ubiquinone oxidoreductase 29.9 kDa subunit [Penicillium argentinense]
MRATLRLLANVKPRYLEPFAPTGLTGLTTHPSPRPTLIYYYYQTLHKLQSFPESSAYRQSVEATTRHRLNIVESKIPPGFEAWKERVDKLLEAEPERFASLKQSEGPFRYVGRQVADGTDDPRGQAWDGEEEGISTEGPVRTPEELAEWEKLMEEASREPSASDWIRGEVKLENEPALEADQVAQIEKEIGHGLLEEVIEVAKAELQLVDQMHDAKVWEELEEKPAPGQWSYFERH